MKKTDNSLHHTAAAASASKNAASTKLTAKARKAALTLGAEPEEKEEKKESGLATPTSISMQTTFIITNADESFDAYYHMMKKRKIGQGASGLDGTMGTNQGLSATLHGGSPGA